MAGQMGRKAKTDAYDRSFETHHEEMGDQTEHELRLTDQMQDAPVYVQSNKARIWSEK